MNAVSCNGVNDTQADPCIKRSLRLLFSCIQLYHQFSITRR